LDSSIKLFSNLYLPKFIETSAKFPCLINELIFVNKGLYRAHFKTIYLMISALVSINAMNWKMQERSIFTSELYSEIGYSIIGYWSAILSDVIYISVISIGCNFDRIVKTIHPV